jgi:hypothetical protein
LLLLALLQLALVPLLGGRDVELAPLFRVDSLGLLFGTAWTLTLAAISLPLARQGKIRKIGLYLGIVGVLFVVCAYAQNMAVLAASGALAAVGIWAIQHDLRESRKPHWRIEAAISPAIVVIVLAITTGLPEFAPPAGGVAAPWRAVAAMAGVLVVASGIGWGLLGARQPAGSDGEGEERTALPALYALATSYILAKMLVAAPWDALGAWLLVLLGTLVLLAGVYIAYTAQGRQRTKAFACALVGVSLTGFGIAANSPLAAAGAVWVLLAGLLWLAGRGWRGAEVTAILAVLPGLWMVSQAALDTGYGTVAALLLPAYVLLAALVTSGAPRPYPAWRWWGFVPVPLAVVATAMPQIVEETLVRPAVRTLAGGVGALTSLAVDWGLGMLVRTSQGTTPAALPATGIALAVFLAAVALYWLKQLARNFERPTGGEAQGE